MNRLKEFRIQKHLTQKQLVVELRKQGITISQDSISKYEKGDRNPTEKKWNQLAKFFNTNVDVLKGIGPNQLDVIDKIISTIHSNFFAVTYKEKNFFKETSLLTFVIHQYLKLTNQDRVPYSFYKDKQNYILNNNIKEFWKGCFKRIITDPVFINSLIGINDQETFDFKLMQKISELTNSIATKTSFYNLNIMFTKNGLELVDPLEKILEIKNVKIYDMEGNDITDTFSN